MLDRLKLSGVYRVTVCMSTTKYLKRKGEKMNYHYIKPEQYIELYTELASRNTPSSEWCLEKQHCFVAECNAIEAILYSNGIVIED